MSFGVIAAVTTVVAGVGSVVAGNSARRSQKSAVRAEQEITKIQNKQTKREFLQSFRDAMGEQAVSNIASLGGGYESSRGFAAASSLNTQRDLGLREFQRQEELGARAINKRLDAARYGFYSNTFGQIASFSMSPVGRDFLNSIGKKPPPGSPGGATGPQ